MSDLKRKYYGLKQAHKELSVEVVGLREHMKELESDHHRLANEAQGLVAKYRIQRDTLKAVVVKVLSESSRIDIRNVQILANIHDLVTTALKEAT